MALIELSGSYSGQFALVDDKDVSKISHRKWYVAAGGYVCSGYGEALHRLIMPKKVGLVIDHINGDKLDNRRENLRYCTQHQNIMNSPANRKGSSPYKGVRRRGEKWVAYIQCNGKNNWLGTFDDLDAAAKAYNQKAKELFGEYAYLNDI